MSGFEFKIRGAKELDNALKSLGIELETKIAKSAIRAAAVVVAKEAKLRAPADGGVLKNSIQVVTRSKRKGAAVASVVTRSGKRWNAKNMNAWYAGKVEFGTIYVPARPFLRPALDVKGAAAVKRMSEVINKKITLFAKKATKAKAK